MFRKLNIIVLALVINLCFISITTVSAENIYNNSMHNKYSNTYQPPGRSIENDIIISFLAPYIYDAFTKQNIKAKEFVSGTAYITSLERLPDNKFKIQLYINAFTEPPFEPPYGFYNVTVITDGKSVDVTEITPAGS